MHFVKSEAQACEALMARSGHHNRTKRPATFHEAYLKSSNHARRGDL